MCTISTATPAATDGSPSRREEAEQRPQPLAAGRERLAGDLLREPRPRGDRPREPRLDLGHVRRRAPASRAPARAVLIERPPCAARRSSRRAGGSARRRSPCVAHAARRAPRRSGTASPTPAGTCTPTPPGSTLPSSGTTRSNQSEKNGRSDAARLRDLEDREPAAGRSTRRSSRNASSRSATLRTPKPTVAASNVAVRERQREHVALHPLELRAFRRARSSIAREKSSPVTRDPRPPSRSASARSPVPHARVEHAVARPHGRLRGEPAPAHVEARPS